MTTTSFCMTPCIIKRDGVEHMAVCECRGTIYFTCEFQPLTTIQSFGFPVRCPVCRVSSPLGKPEPAKSGQIREGEPTHENAVRKNQ